MRKILEMKAEGGGEGLTPDTGVSDAQRARERERVEKEVGVLRESIQTVCRSANPLGKPSAWKEQCPNMAA